MAHLYGHPQTEKEVIRKIGMDVHKLEDVKILLENLRNKLDLKKKDFFRDLPDTIKQEKKKLTKFNSEMESIESEWHKKIDSQTKLVKERKRQIVKNHQLYFILLLPFLYIAIFFNRNLLMPNAVSGIKKDISKQKIVIERYKKEPDNVFQELEEELIGNIQNVENVISSPDYSGAIGEISTLNELKKLGDSYHIFCDLRISTAPRYITYNGEKNLQSAQIDFVVVGRSGVFVIEVKNWSSRFIHDGTRKFTPHEQVDREGLLMYILLKDVLNLKPRVTKVLVSLQNNIPYLKEFKYVFVRNATNINYFIQKQQEYYSHEDVEKIVSLFKSDYE